MSDVTIQAKNLGKAYVISHNSQRTRYKTLREDMIGALKWPLDQLGGRKAQTKEQFWALHNVSFEIKQGEVVGIIGRNGAGKSTLLKVLSQITEPTHGYADVFGRIGSLLEVGTGFHPELTGRENIFLNGAILGMSREEIKRKFDEIVDFAEVEKFLDTPVKRYSSGMYVRLAFSVAAHLEPEVLVLDEVLAVGDVAFQKKCLGKMENVAKNDGRTVLFVSHNMATVSQLCTRVIYLEEGELKDDGLPENVIKSYLGGVKGDEAELFVNESKHAKDYGGLANIRLVKVEAVEHSFNTFQYKWREPIKLLLTFKVIRPLKNVIFGFGVTSVQGVRVLAVHNNDYGQEYPPFEPGTYQVEVCLENPFRDGVYLLDIGAHNALSKDNIFLVPEAVKFEVLDISIDDIPYVHTFNGVVNGESDWQPPKRIA